MKRESLGPVLTTVFVDYDNIYLSLKRKNEDAAKRLAKDSGMWLKRIASGELITATNAFSLPGERRIVMNRCYGNPVPRRNTHDNSTDMNSFLFVRHHFLRSGFEVIDCPPLTAQLKNSADIRIVMDVRDILDHNTYFDEFIILSGDADFTPLLHRLRAHARRTVVFANDYTAQPYTAISDGEIRESSLISLLTSNRTISGESPREIAVPTPTIDVEVARKAILAEVIDFVRNAPQAIPLETLAERVIRIVGRDKTVEMNWGGYGSFRDLLLADLPENIHLSDAAPYTVFDANRHISTTELIAPQFAPPAAESQPQRRTYYAPEPIVRAEPQSQRREYASEPVHAAVQLSQQATLGPARVAAPIPQSRYIDRASATPARPIATQVMTTPASVPLTPWQQQLAVPQAQEATNYQQPEPRREPLTTTTPSPQQQQPAVPQALPAAPPVTATPHNADQAIQIQQSIACIHEACQAPALAPAEYRVLFNVMSQEISTNGPQGAQTLVNITQRAREFGLDVKRDDLRFIYDVVSESDPWFEQGTPASLFASRFRNFVVARCRSHGLSLSADELDLIEAWFLAPPQQQAASPAQHTATALSKFPGVSGTGGGGECWWNQEEGRQNVAEQRGIDPRAANTHTPPQGEAEDEFPRIVRSRFRG